MSAYSKALTRAQTPTRQARVAKVLKSHLVTLGQWALPRSMPLVRLMTWLMRMLRLTGV